MKKHASQRKSPSKDLRQQNYFYRMSHASDAEEGTGPFMLLPAIFFSSFVILLVRMYSFTRPMGQFFWTAQTDASPLTDFFSYYKMLAIVLCTVLTLVLLLYKVTSQSLEIKRTYAYIPMGIYAFLVALSYIFSEHKAFAWLGWNDRFEGTLVLLCYMVMLFFIFNMVKTETDVRLLLGPLAASSILLSLLGISQALGFDFFQTTPGQKLIVANTTLGNGLTMWESIDAAAANGEPFLSFTFQNKQIYQTVYNINYVSFYLTLLIPLFGMLFILAFMKGRDEKPIKKIGLAVLFALLIYNLIGSASSGGFLGLGVIGIMGLVVLNKKLIQWARPLLILFVITGLVAGITSGRWMPELTGAARSVLGTQAVHDSSGPLDTTEVEPGTIKPYIDYIKTSADHIDLSINGQGLTIRIDKAQSGEAPRLTLLDAGGKQIGTGSISPGETPAGEAGGMPVSESGEEQATEAKTTTPSIVYSIEDERFRPYLTLQTSRVEDGYYIIMNTAQTQWRFPITPNGIYYLNRMGKMVSLYDVAHVGFENNPNFGSWRGYTWSRNFPLLKNSLLLGTGADTYCAVFPQEDYAGKYSTSSSNNLDIVVDKPHNMYLHAWIGTGGLSVLALLALYGIYLAQSFFLYRRSDFGTSYLAFAGAGIFFGITGFLAAALVNDSSVSVMPMFYSLFGIGLAVNALLISSANETA